MKTKSLQEWRDSKVLSQRELALAAGVSPATINRIETGKVKTKIMPKTKRAISKALGVDPSEIEW
ncbi:MAG: helix-turn-helix transcriptional regulator [Sphaerochaetaceae bacterium]|jgi:transcriptional regulator with XRE-family HTH domain